MRPSVNSVRNTAWYDAPIANESQSRASHGIQSQDKRLVLPSKCRYIPRSLRIRAKRGNQLESLCKCGM